MTPDPETTLALPVTEETLTLPVVPEPADTRPFAGASLAGLPDPDASVTLIPAPQPADDGPCRCGTCGTAPEPGKDALLYYGPGIATRMWEMRIRNGQWADIAAEFNAAHARTHLPTLKRHGEICLDLSTGGYALAAVFTVHPEARADVALAERFRDVEARFRSELEAQRTYMRHETEQRISLLQSDLVVGDSEGIAA